MSVTVEVKVASEGRQLDSHVKKFQRRRVFDIKDLEGCSIQSIRVQDDKTIISTYCGATLELKS